MCRCSSHCEQEYTIHLNLKIYCKEYIEMYYSTVDEADRLNTVVILELCHTYQNYFLAVCQSQNLKIKYASKKESCGILY
jgi:hypothetical protein